MEDKYNKNQGYQEKLNKGIRKIENVKKKKLKLVITKTRQFRKNGR